MVKIRPELSFDDALRIANLTESTFLGKVRIEWKEGNSGSIQKMRKNFLSLFNFYRL